MDNDRSTQAKHLACWLTLMLLFAWQMAHPAMMLKTSSRIKGKTLNLFIMPMVVNKTPLDVQIELASARDNSSHYLKVTDFLGALGLPYEEDDQLFRVFTTIGQTNLRKEDCRIVNDYWVMDMQLLSETAGHGHRYRSGNLCDLCGQPVVSATAGRQWRTGQTRRPCTNGLILQPATTAWPMSAMNTSFGTKMIKPASSLRLSWVGGYWVDPGR